MAAMFHVRRDDQQMGGDLATVTHMAVDYSAALAPPPHPREGRYSPDGQGAGRFGG